MLELYKNIKKRRNALGLSQQELAELVGYKGKSMISQIERGLVDISQSMIEKFAEVLKCTPSDLMGWEEPTEPPTTSDFHVTVTTEWGPAEAEDYREMLECYKDLSEEDKKKIRSYIEFLSQQK